MLGCDPSREQAVESGQPHEVGDIGREADARSEAEVSYIIQERLTHGRYCDDRATEDR